jgi:Tfp pilus assembly protein PilO
MKISTGLIGAVRYSLRCGGVRLGAQAALATALFGLLVALAWWGPAMREQMRLQQVIDAHRAEAGEAMRSSRVAHAQREALLAVAMLEKKLEVRAGQAELIQGIAGLASQRGVRVISQSFDQGRVQSGDAPLYLELGLLGNYPALRGLMDDLATLPMWIELVEARIDRAGESGTPLKAQLRLLTYRAAKGLP